MSLYILKLILLFLSTIGPLLISVAFFTLAERKIIAAIQRRNGPNHIFIWGLLQPFADGLKALLKEFIFPSRADFMYFLLSPALTFLISLVGWALMPFSWDIFFFDHYLSLIFFLLISSLGFYGTLLAGWSSNSKYAFLGALRVVAQIISYEIVLGLSILPLICFSGTFNFLDLVYSQKRIWNIYIYLPFFFILLISALAETNRTPFDLPEAEAEIVAGYNIEYSGFTFALFFLGEYSNMLLNTMLISLVFLGGWLPVINCLTVYLSTSWLVLKMLILCFVWIFVRANLPRYRYDQLMDLGWKFFIPLALAFFYLYITIGLYFNGFPFIEQIPTV